jgi:peroxiredoxin 3
MSIVKAIIQKAAPAFKGTAYIPESKAFKEISLSDFAGKYVVLFFYPLDFTFVCPTEIMEFSSKAEQFQQVGCELIGVSVDSHFSHKAWVELPRENGGLGGLRIPLLADLNKTVSQDYGVLIEGAGIALRGTFIIDSKGVLRHSSVNDLPVGRNVNETLRLVKAFQFTDKHGEVCPANWKEGEPTMEASHDSSKTADYWRKVHAKK